MDKIKPQSRLTFLRIVNERYIDDKGVTKNPRALYRCDCGVEKEIVIGSVKSGAVVSCGCYHRSISKQIGKKSITHGLSTHPLRHIYGHIKDRCYNPKCNAYKNYGGVGVIMCDEWFNDFVSFYNWCINNGWKQGLEIDKDEKYARLGLKSLCYSPETCSIVTRAQNGMHKKQSVYFEYKGLIKTIMEWAIEYGIKYPTLRARLMVHKHPIEKALTKPVTKYKLL